MSHDPTTMHHPNISKLLGIYPVEGEIGAGKTKVLDLLQESFPSVDGVGVIYVREPSDIWSRPQQVPEEYPVPQQEGARNEFTYLDLFYQDSTRYAFPFQMYAYCTRTRVIDLEIQRIVAQDLPFIIVCERSVLTDKEVFTKNLVRSGLIAREFIPIYDELFNYVASHMVGHIKGMLHLDVDVATCMDRIRKRNRGAEAGIPESYLLELAKAHEEMYAKYQDKIPVTRVDWRGDWRDESVLKGLKDAFLGMVRGCTGGGADNIRATEKQDTKE